MGVEGKDQSRDARTPKAVSPCASPSRPRCPRAWKCARALHRPSEQGNTDLQLVSVQRASRNLHIPPLQPLQQLQPVMGVPHECQRIEPSRKRCCGHFLRIPSKILLLLLLGIMRQSLRVLNLGQPSIISFSVWWDSNSSLPKQVLSPIGCRVFRQEKMTSLHLFCWRYSEAIFKFLKYIYTKVMKLSR